ncbi:DUF4265 domain-containing protein [Novilysobacter antarcticus]|uniref:DUF4265 domain-containing protein n=1 Tax=Novilysobacter antarcticus TaxID=2862543 RepID=UPI001C996B43|nr:DUF4265 domain-containing protein [Lysobacter antarcticus]
MEPVQQLTFSLHVEDDWPPVAAECLPVEEHLGGFRLLSPPLFVKRLSVGDVIRVEETINDQVVAWTVQSASQHSTIWAMAFGGFDLGPILSKARALGCHTATFSSGALAAVDVPPTVTAHQLDSMLTGYDEAELAVVYPSWRHEESLGA